MRHSQVVVENAQLLVPVEPPDRCPRCKRPDGHPLGAGCEHPFHTDPMGETVAALDRAVWLNINGWPT